MMKKGKLYLIPNILGSDTTETIPPYIVDIVKDLREFIVENERNARRYIIKLGVPSSRIDSIYFQVLDKHRSDQSPQKMLEVALSGKDVGLISDAGVPAVADPGALIVAEAHNLGIEVIPLVGPSSILMAVMGSGLNGQQFTFNGYLPIDRTERIKKIKALEKISAKNNTTQLFIETPYRNEQLFQVLINVLQNHTKLSVATNLTLSTQKITTQSIAKWKKSPPPLLKKQPTVFSFLA